MTEGTRTIGKVRSPWTVWLLTLVTVGIYGIYWYYALNAELKEYDSRVEVNPGIAALALFVPIAGFISIMNTGNRIAQVQEAAGVKGRCSGGMGLVFSFLLGYHIVYYQTQINEAWAGQ